MSGTAFTQTIVHYAFGKPVKLYIEMDKECEVMQVFWASPYVEFDSIINSY